MTERKGRIISLIIADDDCSVRSQLREYLENSSYRIMSEACDGIDAVEKCRAHKPDLVLLDIAMPLMDGIAAAKAIKREGLAKTIVMLTSFTDSENIEKALSAGASGYLTKPVERDNVFTTLETCLNRSKECYLAQKEYNNLKKRFEGRRYIDEAKLLIMERQGITEPEAYEMIRELSRLKGLSMEEISKYITDEGRH